VVVTVSRFPVAASVAAFSLGLAAGLAGCSSSAQKNADFDRHRFSQLVQPYGQPERLFFDVRYPPEYPQDDLAAEEARFRWLATWLTLRKMCPAGHDVVRRRPFDYLEDNPAGFTERWEIACRAPQRPAGGGG
jgi:hypothetical protein